LLFKDSAAWSWLVNDYITEGKAFYEIFCVVIVIKFGIQQNSIQTIS
jgi:hypothetical protein